MHINWKKTTIVTLDLLLAGYLVLAATSFTHPDTSQQACRQVSISISDDEGHGFLSASDIKQVLVGKGIYPHNQSLEAVDPRTIEETLASHPLIDGVECHKTIGGTVCIDVSQRMPCVRVMPDDGTDYYLDKDGRVMYAPGYASDLLVATGHISQQYARDYLTPASRVIGSDPFWRDQVEQINILPDGNMEIVPRVGNHVACLGRLPEHAEKERREREIEHFLSHKLNRLYKFYIHGLNQVGWNKYEYIDVEFDNQVICRKAHKRHDAEATNTDEKE